jgi:hypothetical protein
MGHWYHGTNEYFSSWKKPPIHSKYKPNFFPHSFISFSKDIHLAKQAGKIANGLCKASLSDRANILDLRMHSKESQKHWEFIRNTEHGKVHKLMQTFDEFTKSCNNGEILRMHTHDSDTNKEPYKRLHQLQGIVNNPTATLKERTIAHLTIQNFTRQWVETVLSPAKENNYHAVICAEIDRYRASGPTECINISVFNPSILSAPEWINVPNESNMKPYMQKIQQLGLDKTKI